MKIPLGHKGAYIVVTEGYLTAYKYNDVAYRKERSDDYFSGTQQALKYIKR